MKKLLLEETEEDIVLKFLQDTIRGTEWENKVWLAGGAVRDEIMGKKPKDLDFTVLGSLDSGIKFSEWLAHKLGNYKQGSNPVVYERFGTAKLSTNYNRFKLPNIELEFVAPRKEVYEPGSRKPIVSAGTIEDDAKRRDLTINSLLKNISNGQVFDVTGRGISDIKKGIIKTTTDPDIIFKEDPLRMMRAIRFTVKYGFKMEEAVLNGIKKDVKSIETISIERITDEFNKIMVSPDPKTGIELLLQTGLLRFIMPELQKAVGVTQGKHHDQDVFQHILTVVSNTPPDLPTRLMALFHDIGKPETRSVGPDGDVHFYEHEHVGANIAREIMTRMKYPNDTINTVVKGVDNHMRLKDAGEDGEKVTDKTLRKFVNKAGEDLQYMLDLMQADNLSHKQGSVNPNQITGVRDRINSLEDKVDSKQVNLPINGHDLIALGLKPGPMFKEIMELIQDAWYENPNLTREEAMEIVRQYLLDKNISEIKQLMKKML